VIFFLFILAACATESPLPRAPLIDQVLSVRPNGEPVLSNRVYVECGKDDWCSDLATYDLRDAEIRDKLFKFQFVCRVGGRRFGICADRPGFCRTTYSGALFWKKKEVEYLGIEQNYKMLSDSMTTCFSELRREWDEVD